MFCFGKTREHNEPFEKNTGKSERREKGKSESMVVQLELADMYVFTNAPHNKYNMPKFEIHCMRSCAHP